MRLFIGWTFKETKALLNCYLARKEEFQCFRKKKFAYQNLVEDLTSMDVLESPVTATLVENKIKSMLRAYKTAVDNNKKTGSSPCIEPFATKMEEIFGRGICAPEDTSHVVHAGSSFSKPATSLERNAKFSEGASPNFEFIQLDVPKIQTSPSSTALVSTSNKNKYRKSLKERLFKKKIAFQKEKEQSKLKRWEEKKHIFKEQQKGKREEKKKSAEAKAALIKELIATIANNK